MVNALPWLYYTLSSRKVWWNCVEHGKTGLWWCLQTLETTWERPESHAWKTASSPDHDGLIYYVNDVTNDAVWEKPEPLAWEKQIFTHGAMAESL